MQVLWFSNTPALGQEYLNQKSLGTGGWMAELDKCMQEVVELSVAFTYPYSITPFQYGKTMYYPVYTGNIIIENLKQRWLNKIYDKDFLPDYLKVIETVKPDIIHIHGTENSFSCIIDQVKIPVVVSIQGNLTVYYQKFRSGLFGDFIHTTQYNLDLKSLLFGTPNFFRSYKKLGRMSLIEQSNLKKTKHIIGRTDWDRRISRVLSPESNYHTGNEILRDSFYKNTWNHKTIFDKLVIHTTNGNNYYKGFETLCHALTLLIELGLDLEWRVAGISKNSLINKIVKKQLKQKYPQKGLVLLGSLNEQELVERLKEAHIYVMTSHIENSPNNLCEAMILGMPCIATLAGGTGSMLKDGNEGILIQGGDPWALAGAILEIKNDTEKAIKYGKAAREKALKRHNKESITTNLLEIYKLVKSGQLNGK